MTKKTSRLKYLIVFFSFFIITIPENAYALEKEFQIIGTVINAKNQEPLPNAEAIMSFYYVNANHTIKETFYKKRLQTNAFGKFKTPIINVKIHSGQVYKLRLMISHPSCEDAVLLKEFLLDKVGNTMELALALNPKGFHLKIKGVVKDAITDQPINNNQVNLYLASYDIQKKSWQHDKKISQNTSFSSEYNFEIPYHYTPSAMNNRYRFDLTVSHLEFEEIETRLSAFSPGKSTPQREYYDFSTLECTSYLIWSKTYTPLLMYLTDLNNKPVANQMLLLTLQSGSISDTSGVSDGSYKGTTDNEGKVLFSIPSNYVYCKKRFFEIVSIDLAGIMKKKNFTKRYTTLLTQNDNSKIIQDKLNEDFNIEIFINAKNQLLTPWEVGSWWEVSLSSKNITNKILLFKIESIEEIEFKKYFQVSVSGKDNPEKKLFRLYYQIPDLNLKLVFDDINKQKHVFSNTPVVFFGDFPLDFPILEKIFSKGRYLLTDAGGLLNLKIDKQQFFKSNSLSQTTKEAFGVGSFYLSTTLDLTVDNFIYFTSIDWFPGRPWWTNYKKEMINNETSELTIQCQAELISFGYQNRVFYKNEK